MTELRDTEEGRYGAWMQTFTGRKFFPKDPRPEDVCVSDIAHALSMACRYAGHTRRFYSVAEHSVLMFRYGLVECQFLADEGEAGASQLLARAAVVALFHDAAEAYTSDLPRAVKQAAGSQWKWLEHKIEDAVWTHLDLTQEVHRHQVLVKEWDQRIVPTDRLACMRREEVWAHDAPTPRPVEIRCWSPEQAKQAFILAYWEACKIMGWDPEEIET